MTDTSTDARQKRPSRRTVVKVGANAAWAVPAIQIVAATPAFAASGDQATLTVSLVSAFKFGSTASITVRVTANKFAVKNVLLAPSGDTTTTATTSVGSLAAGRSTTKTLTLALSNAAASTGTIAITATGDTDSAGSKKKAIPGVYMAYVTAAIDLPSSQVAHSYSYNSRTNIGTGTVTFKVTAGDFVGADIKWTVTPTAGVRAGSSATTGTVRVAHNGTSTIGPLTYTWSGNQGTKKFSIAISGTTANDGKAATNTDSIGSTNF